MATGRNDFLWRSVVLLSDNLCQLCLFCNEFCTISQLANVCLQVAIEKEVEEVEEVEEVDKKNTHCHFLYVQNGSTLFWTTLTCRYECTTQ